MREMSELAVCCKDLALEAPTESPFSRFVLMDNVSDSWWGAAECGRCLTPYRLDSIDIGDRFNKDGKFIWPTMVFSLRRLPEGSFAQLESTLPARRPVGFLDKLLGSPRLQLSQWPVWVVNWDLPTKAREQLLENLNNILDKAEPLEMVFASNNPPEVIFAAKGVSSEDLASTEDWFSFLGVGREPRE